ncbi:hypothetical protein, conserved [Trypanosoma brucei gambiense DAL972]|uniref:Ubiquitin-protein ligase n=1 Tax=Trypanosoma brucei gambiense (strain MHOM/CI/86/DAL972) TaxID=679716 RepID=D0A6G4_TRYB9|nr:hypothetical protein, conserved [Trypanosoma brucei gambiense DAL972]CBH17265.1 hypothetical protein, conserved [Trypanosoma brucei gambiense DAL972]|eukprot:XP_011779529.1 hypothetical protein, conserved [Trypanosoma brucei gambiense DAL972]
MDGLSTQYLQMANGPQSQMHDPVSVVNFVDQMQLAFERSTAPRKNFLLDSTTPRGDAIITEVSAMKPGNGWVTLQVTEGIRRGVHEWGVTIENQGETTDGSGLMLGIVPKSFSKYDSFISQGGGWCLSRAGKFYGHWRRHEANASVTFGTGDRVIFILDYEAARMTVRVGDKYVVGEISNIAPEVFPAVSLHYRHQFVRFEYRKVHDRQSKKLNWIERLAFPHATVFLPLTRQQLEDVPLGSYVFSPLFAEGQGCAPPRKRQGEHGPATCESLDTEERGAKLHCDYEAHSAAKARLTVVLRAIQAVRRYCTNGVVAAHTFLDRNVTAEMLRSQRHALATRGSDRRGGGDAAVDCGALILIHMFSHSSMTVTGVTMLPVLRSLQEYLRSVDLFSLSEASVGCTNAGTVVSPDVVRMAADNVAGLIDRARRNECDSSNDTAVSGMGSTDAGISLVPGLTELLVLVALQCGTVCEVLRAVRVLLRAPTSDVSPEMLTWLRLNKAALTPKCYLPKLHEAYDAIEEDMEHVTPFAPTIEVKVVSVGYHRGAIYVHTADTLRRWGVFVGAYTPTSTTTEPRNCCLNCTSSSIAFMKDEGVIFHTDRMAGAGIAVVVYSSSLEIQQTVMLASVPQWPTTSNYVRMCSGPGHHILLVYDVPHSDTSSALRGTAAPVPSTTAGALTDDASKASATGIEVQVLNGKKFPEVKWRTKLQFPPFDNTTRSCVTLRKGSVIDFGNPETCLNTTGGHITVEVWIKMLDKNDVSVFYQHGDRSTSGEVFLETARLEGAWRIRGGYRHDYRGMCVVSAPFNPASESRFVHVALVFDGNWRLHFDGEEVSRTKQCLQVALENPRQRWTAGNDCVCQLAGLRVWKGGRTFREIARDSSRVLGGDEPGLVCQYLFNEHNGNVVYNHVRGEAAAGRHAIVRGAFSRTVCNDHPLLASAHSEPALGTSTVRVTAPTYDLPKLEHAHVFYDGVHLGILEQKERAFHGFAEMKCLHQAVFFDIETGRGVYGSFMLRHRYKLGLLGCDENGRYWELFQAGGQPNVSLFGQQQQQQAQLPATVSAGTLSVSPSAVLEEDHIAWHDNLEFLSFTSSVKSETPGDAPKGSIYGDMGTSSPTDNDTNTQHMSFGALAIWLLNLLSSFSESNDTASTNSLFSPLLDDVSVRCVQEIRQLLHEHCRPVKSISSRRSLSLKDSTSTIAIGTAMRILLRLVRRVRDFRIHPDTIGLSEAASVGDLRGVFRELNAIQRRRSTDWSKAGDSFLTTPSQAATMAKAALSVPPKDIFDGISPTYIPHVGLGLLGILLDIINESGLSLPTELGSIACIIVNEGVTLFFPTAVVRANLLREILGKEEDSMTRSPALSVLLHAIVRSFTDVTSAAPLLQITEPDNGIPRRNDGIEPNRGKNDDTAAAYGKLAAVKSTLSTLVVECTQQVMRQAPNNLRQSQLSLLSTMAEAIGVLQMLLFSHCDEFGTVDVHEKMNKGIENMHSLHGVVGLGATARDYYTELFDNAGLIFETFAQRLEVMSLGEEKETSGRVSFVLDVLGNSFVGSPLHTAITALPLMCSQEESGWLLGRLNHLSLRYRALLCSLRASVTTGTTLGSHRPLHVLDTALSLASSWVASFMSLGQISAPTIREESASPSHSTVSTPPHDNATDAPSCELSTTLKEICDHPLLAAGIKKDDDKNDKKMDVLMKLQQRQAEWQSIARRDVVLASKTPVEIEEVISMAAIAVVHLSSARIEALTMNECIELLAKTLVRLKGLRSGLLDKRSKSPGDFLAVQQNAKECCHFLLRVARVSDSTVIQMPSLYLARTYADRAQGDPKRPGNVNVDNWKRAVLIMRMKRLYHRALVYGWSLIQIPAAVALVERIILSPEIKASDMREAFEERERGALRRLSGLQHMYQLFQNNARLGCKVASLLFNGRVGGGRHFELGISASGDSTRCSYRQMMYDIIRRLCEITRPITNHKGFPEATTDGSASPASSPRGVVEPCRSATLSEVLNRQWLPSDFCFFREVRVVEVMFLSFCSIFQPNASETLRHERALELSHRGAVKGNRTHPVAGIGGSNNGTTFPSSTTAMSGGRTSGSGRPLAVVAPGGVGDEGNEQTLQRTPSEWALLESLNALKSLGLQCAAALGDENAAPNEVRGCVNFLDLVFEVLDEELRKCANYASQPYHHSQDRVLEHIGLLCTLISTFARALPAGFICTEVVCPKAAFLAFRLWLVADVMVLASAMNVGACPLAEVCVHTSILLLRHCSPAAVNPLFTKESIMSVVRKLLPAVTADCAAVGYFFSFAIRCVSGDSSTGGSGASGSALGNFGDIGISCVASLHALLCSHPWDETFSAMRGPFLADLADSANGGEAMRPNGVRLLMWIYLIGGPPSASLGPGRKVFMCVDETLAATEEAYIVDCNAKAGTATVLPIQVGAFTEEHEVPLDNLINASQDEVLLPRSEVLFQFLLPALEQCFSPRLRPHSSPLPWAVIASLLRITLAVLKKDPSASYVLLERGIIAQVDDFAFRTPAKTPLPLRYLYEMWPLLLPQTMNCQQRALFDAVTSSSKDNDAKALSSGYVYPVRTPCHDIQGPPSDPSAHTANSLFSVAAAARYSVLPRLDVECSNADVDDYNGSGNMGGSPANISGSSVGCTGLPPLFSRLQQAHSSLCLTPSVLCFSGARGDPAGTLIMKGVSKDSCIPPWADGITIEASVLLYDRLFPELGEAFVIPASWGRPPISFSLFSLYEKKGDGRRSFLRVVLDEARIDCIIETAAVSAVVISTKLLQEDWDHWIHLAVVIDSKSITLYKDGAGVAAALPKHLGIYLENLFREGSVDRLVIGNISSDGKGTGRGVVSVDETDSDEASSSGGGRSYGKSSNGVVVALDSVRLWGCARSMKTQRSAADFVAREQTLPVYGVNDGSNVTFRFSEATGNETYAEKCEGVGVLSGSVRWAPFPVFSSNVNLDKVQRTGVAPPTALPLFIPRREFESFFATLDHSLALRLGGEYMQSICAHLSRQCVVAAIQQAMSPQYRVVHFEHCRTKGCGDVPASAIVDPRNIIASTELISHLINLLRYSDTGYLEEKAVLAVSQFVKVYFSSMTSEKRLLKGFREAAVAITKALHDETEPFCVELPTVSYVATDANLVPIATINGPGGVVSFDANSRGIEQMTLLRDRKQRVLLAKYPDAQSGWPELEVPSDSLWFYAKPSIGTRSVAPSFTVSARSLKPQVACAIFAALREVLSSDARFHCGLGSFLNAPFISLLTVRTGTTKCAAVPSCRIFTSVLELWREFPQFSQQDQCPLKITLANLNAPLMSVLQRGHASVASSPIGRHNVRVQSVFELLVAAIRTEAAWDILTHNQRTQIRWRRLCSLWERSIGLCAPAITIGVNSSALPASATTALGNSNRNHKVSNVNAGERGLSSSEHKHGYVHLVLLPFSGSTLQHQPKASIFQRGSGVWNAFCDRGFLSARSNVGFKHGRFYFEVRIPANGDPISVGAVTERAQQNSFLSPRGLGHDGDSWGFESAQMCRFYHGFRHEFTMRTKWKGLDVIGIMLDLETDTLACLHEERQVSVFDNFRASLGAGVPLSFFPAVSFGAGGVDVNFGAAPFVYRVPAGFVPVDPSNYMASPTSTPWMLISAIDVSECLARSGKKGTGTDASDGVAVAISSSKETRQLPPFLARANASAATYYEGRSGPLCVNLLPCGPKNKMTSVQGSEVRAEEDPRFFRGSVCVRSGRWYYEVGLRGDALISVGWATSTTATDWSRSRGLGDDAESWVLEGNRATARHNKHTRSVGGQLWKHGDIVGCLLDCEAGTIAYTLNGVPLQEAQNTDGEGILFRSVNHANGLMPVIGVDPKNTAVVCFCEEELSHLPKRCRALGTTSPLRKAVENHFCGVDTSGVAERGVSGVCSTQFSPSLARRLLLTLSSLTELNFHNGAAYCLEDTLTKTDKAVLCDKFLGHKNAMQLLVTLQNLTSLAEAVIPYAGVPSIPMECDVLLSGPIRRALDHLHDYMLPAVGLRFLHGFFSQTSSAGENLKLTLNRRKALSLVKDTTATLPERLSGSIFGQVYQLLHDKNVSLFCTSRKLWSVNFVGEGADDIGGPYRESITQLCSELMGPSLPLFIPSPNQASEIGESREVFVVRPEMEAPVRLNMYHFFGRFLGGCLRSSEPVPIYLSSRVWKTILGAPVGVSDLGRVDVATVQSYRYIQQLSSLGGGEAGATDGEVEELCPGGFTVVDDIGVERELFPGGSAISVGRHNVDLFLELAMDYRLHVMGEAQIKAIADGFHQVVPVSAVSLLKWYELERMVCGLPDYDADELLDAARYEDLNPDSVIVQYLRQVLRQFSRHERALFMRFVSGRERLPSGVRLKVMLDTSAQQTRDERGNNASGADNAENSNMGGDTFDDSRLPHASTCFYWLSLPRYSSVEVMRERLLFAIQHCLDIDADFMVRDTGSMEDEGEPMLAVIVEDDDEFEDFSHLR